MSPIVTDRQLTRGRAGGLLLAAALAAALPATRAWAAESRPATGPQPQVVYGQDNRREVYGLSGAKAAAAASTVALVDASRLTPNGSGFRLATEPLGPRIGLCQGQRFFNQPTGAGCSGVLVGPDLVATAGHCVDSQADLAGTRFVFGFRKTDASTTRTTFPASDVYRGTQLVARQLNDATGADYAVVRLDRRVTGRTPQKIARGNPPAVGTPIYVIGHPSGLPAKIAAGARVASTTPFYFDANLDTFGGNSGSPVFDANTNTVVGILVRGATDYREEGGCRVVNTLPDSDGGEASTNTRLFAGSVPQR